MKPSKQKEGCCMRSFRRWLSLLLCLATLLLLCPSAMAEDGPLPYSMTVLVGDGSFRVRAYSESYMGNLYLSLADLALALSGTEKQFELHYSKSNSAFTITTGHGVSSGSSQDTGWMGVAYLPLQQNRLLVNGREHRNYTYCTQLDMFMNMIDVQMILDLEIEPLDELTLRLHPERPFAPEPESLAREGYFDAYNGVLIGDADTGEILFSRNHDRVAPIASITKLMSYLLIREAADAGEISMDDTVTASAKAAVLSWTADGTISLQTGKAYPMSEMLNAMLLASSNECTLALAEHVAGSEEAFVERMNRRAGELELRSARFYTPHGLPSYGTGPVRGKRQNSMSALDLFRLCRFLLAEHPEITDITSQQLCAMKELDYTTYNSNPLVFNLEGVTGLKTGYTNKAGSCLVASMPVQTEDGPHNLVLVVLGAEAAEQRNQAAELLLRWALRLYARKLS